MGPANRDPVGVKSSPVDPGSGARKAAKPISFRPDADVYEILEARAGVLGCSIHELACHYLTNALKEEREDDVSTESVVELLNELREDLAVGIESLLASAGKVTVEEARKWADENLRQ